MGLKKEESLCVEILSDWNGSWQHRMLWDDFSFVRREYKHMYVCVRYATSSVSQKRRGLSVFVLWEIQRNALWLRHCQIPPLAYPLVHTALTFACEQCSGFRETW